MNEVITSTQNPKIKNIQKLDKARERYTQKLFVIEGAREIMLAVEAGYEIRNLLVCRELLNPSNVQWVDHVSSFMPVTEVSSQVFAKIAYRGQSDGLFAVAVPKQHTLENIRLSTSPFIIVLEAVEKPGNLGAILRTADAAQVDAVIICDPQTDLYNPNTIRSGIGCLFTQQIAVCTSTEAHEWLNQSGIAIYATELEASDWYHLVDFAMPSAIVMGTEADGLTDFWLRHAQQRIKIPMRGKIDSLNVSVATAIMTFEAMRQRGFQ